METQVLKPIISPVRKAGIAGILSGSIGIIVIASLIAYLIFRTEFPTIGVMMNSIHDIGVIFQFLLIIPVVLALGTLSQAGEKVFSRNLLKYGVAAIVFTILFLVLGISKVVADVLYMFPQGLFGVWLMVACWRLQWVLSKGLKWFGTVVGFGLALVGTFPPGHAIFVDPIILHIPAITPSDEEVSRLSSMPANIFLHQLLFIGSFMGVLTLPFWTLLLGTRLYKNKTYYGKRF